MTLSSYASGPSANPLLGDTIGADLRATAAAHPENDALVSVAQGVRLTYAQLDAAVDRLAAGLLARGIAARDRARRRSRPATTPR